jgi:hypothetical protein
MSTPKNMSPEMMAKMEQFVEGLDQLESVKSKVYLSEFRRYAPLFRKIEDIKDIGEEEKRVLQQLSYEYEQRFDYYQCITVFKDGHPMDSSNQDNIAFIVPPARMNTEVIMNDEASSLEYLHIQKEHETKQEVDTAYGLLSRDFVQTQNKAISGQKLALVRLGVLQLGTDMLSKTNPEFAAALAKAKAGSAEATEATVSDDTPVRSEPLGEVDDDD